MDKRSILAIILSLMVIYIYQAFFVKPRPATKTTTAPQEKVTTPEDRSPVSPGSPTALRTITPSIQEQKGLKEREIPVETDEFIALFSTRGGAIKSLKLKRYREHIAKDSPLIELVHVKPTDPLPLSLTFPGADINLSEKTIYEAQLNEKDKSTITFITEIPHLIRVEKIYRFKPGRYDFDLEIRNTNLGPGPINQTVGLTWYEYIDPQKKSDSYAHEGPVSFAAKKIERDDPKKIVATKTVGPDVSWGGYETKYFIAALIPQNPAITSLYMSTNGGDLLSISALSPKNIIPPGKTTVVNYTVYLGPKDYSILKSLNVGLENAIDFGDWLKWLAMPLLIVLKFLYNLIPNYGVAIIILTAIIKIIFWPLGNKSYRSMKEMQKLQPKVAELQEKYKNDKNRLSQEIMNLYKTHKINPMGGCLPMLIQIPVFFGLYKTLLYAIELRHSPFIWWIKDLSAKDPYYITPIIMGATMFIQQKMTPTAGDPTQAKIMLLMPAIFTVMFLNFPSGLVIYWLFNNIISIGQQYYINKRLS